MQYVQRDTTSRIIGKGQRKWEQKDQVCRKCWSSPGHARLNETVAALDMPGMSKKTFSNIEMQIGNVWESNLAYEITRAGVLEREMAIERSDSFEGIPAITVTVDGGWSKRSHKHSYNAKSGVAVIIGNATKKTPISWNSKQILFDLCSSCEQGYHPTAAQLLQELERLLSCHGDRHPLGRIQSSRSHARATIHAHDRGR